jgi:hypothetical protein
MGSPSMASSAAREGGRVLKTWQAAMWRRRVAWERYCDGRNRRREALPPRARACRSDRRRATTPAVASSRPSREECRKRRPETHRSGRGRFGSWATSGRWSPGRGFEGRDRSLRWGPSALASQPQRVAATGWGAVWVQQVKGRSCSPCAARAAACSLHLGLRKHPRLTRPRRQRCASWRRVA